MPTKGTPTINNPGSEEINPREEYYYRENPQSELFGPVSYRIADIGALKLSNDLERSGLAEVVTYVGTRAGDPPRDPLLRVVYMYRRGKYMKSGNAAQYHSDSGTPPGT